MAELVSTIDELRVYSVVGKHQGRVLYRVQVAAPSRQSAHEIARKWLSGKGERDVTIDHADVKRVRSLNDAHPLLGVYPMYRENPLGYEVLRKAEDQAELSTS